MLKPFATITEYMSTESGMSVSEIYPMVCGLVIKRLAPSADDISIASKVKEAIKDELVSRYDDDASQSTAALCALLDPRYKMLAFFSSTQRKLTHSELDSRMDELLLRLPSESQSDDSVTSVKRRKLDYLDFGSPDNAMQDALHAYISEKPAPDVDRYSGGGRTNVDSRRWQWLLRVASVFRRRLCHQSASSAQLNFSSTN